MTDRVLGHRAMSHASTKAGALEVVLRATQEERDLYAADLADIEENRGELVAAMELVAQELGVDWSGEASAAEYVQRVRARVGTAGR